MITRELANKVLKELAISMYEYCVNDKKLDEKEATNLAMRLYNHSLVVGAIAEKIAEKSGLDVEKSYIFGLLHDIGRFKPERFHGIVGYEIAMDNNNPELARICLTHVFLSDKKIREGEFPNNDFKKDDIEKTKNILSKIEYNDYDLLIRLCDFMSIGDTIYSSTIDDRILDLKKRYNIAENDCEKLRSELYKIKDYFDEKIGGDLYELLEIKSCIK